MRQQATEPVRPMDTVGHVTRRIDAYERVTGKATYTRDVRLPGMLYGRALRSPHPHARIRGIDVSKAAALPGVRAVITDENARVVWGAGSIAGGRQYNDELKAITKHRRYIFDNPVRFVGQPVAAVAAVNRYVAEEALELIEVDYEELPFVIDPEEALEPGAPPIWPEGNLGLNTENEAKPATRREGDVEAGFQAADRVFENRYTTGFVHDAQMEPRCALAHWEGDKLTLYTPTQGISNCRHDNARDLGLADRPGTNHLPVYGRGVWQQEPESGCGSDRGDAGEGGGGARAARALEEGRLAGRAWPLAHRAVLQGGRKAGRDTNGDSAARLQRHGSVP